MLDYSKITRNGPWMLTASGRRFWPLDPHPDDVTLEDIGWSLSQTCRYNGHVSPPFFYSVAEHLCILSEYFESKNANIYDNVVYQKNLHHAKWAFIHDWPEAYVGDMIRPLKSLFPKFSEIEHNVSQVIWKKFGFEGNIPEEVEWADKHIVNDERMQTWPLEIMQRDGVYERPRLNIQLECLQPVQAYNRFMRKASELGFIQ